MVRFSFKITMLSRRWPISTVSGSTVCPTLRLLLGMVVDLEDALGRASSSWCLEKPTTPNDRRSAHLPGRTQAGQSYLPG